MSVIDAEQVTDLILVLLDWSRLQGGRVAAARHLRTQAVQTAMDAVLQLATADGEDEALTNAAGDGTRKKTKEEGPRSFYLVLTPLANAAVS